MALCPAAPRAGAVGRGAHRERAGHHPGPRPDPGHRAGRRRRRPPHRRAGRADRATWASYLQLVTPGHPAARRLPLRRRLRPARGLLVPVQGRVHDDDAHRRLPGRRPARGHLRHRAGHGPPLPGVGHRPGRAAPAQLHQGRAVPVHRDDRPHLRLRRPRRGARPRRSRWSATTSCGPSRQRRRAAGDPRHLGIGISSYFEMCGLAPSRVLASLNYTAGGWESATVRVTPTNKVQVITGATPHGQGHETSWSMIVADRLGVAPEDVEVLHSDTAISPLGLDTYGSRSLAVGGIAIYQAIDKVIDKARTIAAHLMEAAEEDLEFDGRHVQRAGLPRPRAAPRRGRLRGLHRPQPARRRRAEPRGPRHLRPTQLLVAVRHATSAWSRSTRRPVRSRWCKYVAVDDCGNQINPLIVEGQVHGGVIQGLAQALFEEAVYDDDGNLTTSTLADYLVPAASDVPSITTGSTITPSPTNPLGRQGHRRGGHDRRRTGGDQRDRRRALAARRHRRRRCRRRPRRVWSTIQSADRPQPSTGGAR